MMVGVCLGTWGGAGLMGTRIAPYGTMFLGVALIAYALTGLATRRMSICKTRERWLGPLAGAVTGIITAVTGVFVIPAVPYLKAIGLEKEELVQALGLSFTVSTVALTMNIAAAGAVDSAITTTTLIALVMACMGMRVGQELRLRNGPAAFRRWFFLGLLLLGVYLSLSPGKG